MKILNKNSQKKILLVDDDTALREPLSDYLQEQGYIVITAADGMEASQKMRLQDFSIVISDLNMPRKNGVKLSLEVSKRSEVPIILMTGEMSNFKLGLEGLPNVMVLEKPFKREILKVLIEKLCKKSIHSVSFA
jgi:DNA-binding response OmpR family regulator